MKAALQAFGPGQNPGWVRRLRAVTSSLSLWIPSKQWFKIYVGRETDHRVQGRYNRSAGVVIDAGADGHTSSEQVDDENERIVACP